MILVNFEKQLPRFCLRAAFLAERGTTLVLWGESGAGKTAILENIAGLASPDRGEIIINGNIVYSSFKKVFASPQERRLGFVFHDYALFPHMSVLENVALALGARDNCHARNPIAEQGERLHTLLETSPKATPRLPRHPCRSEGQYIHVQGIPKKKKIRNDDALAVLDRFHIAHLAQQNPRTLSAGEQQRLALARALAVQSDILLMDEPFTALDPRTREVMWGEFREIRKEIRMTVILVTHQYDEARLLGDRVLTLRGGIVYE
jgi:molybdate transport system ATP-binding protein